MGCFQVKQIQSRCLLLFQSKKFPRWHIIKNGTAISAQYPKTGVKHWCASWKSRWARKTRRPMRIPHATCPDVLDITIGLIIELCLTLILMTRKLPTDHHQHRQQKKYGIFYAACPVLMRCWCVLWVDINEQMRNEAELTLTKHIWIITLLKAYLGFICT